MMSFGFMNFKRCLVFLPSFLLIHISLVGELSAMVLADKGQTQFAIVVDDAPLPLEQTAAEELGKYLEKITSAKFPIQKQATGPVIHVGPTRAVQQLLPDVDWAALGTDGIVIRTVGGDLVLAGGRHRGTLFAVYTFLQDFAGCRWWSGDAERVPEQATLVIDALDVIYRPQFDQRVISSSQYGNRVFSLKSRQTIDLEYSFGDHTIDKLLPPDKHFIEHPDWYMYAPDNAFQNDPTTQYTFASMLGGVKSRNLQHYEIAQRTRRIPMAPCLSVPEARRTIGDAVIAQLAEKYPTWKYPPKVVWVTQWDGRQKCSCAKCIAVRATEGSHAALWVTTANEIAERIEDKYPDVLIGTLSYLHTKAPPRTVVPRKNVLIYMAFLDRDHGKPVSDLVPQRDHLAQWSKIASHLWTWDYNTNFRQFVKPHPNYFVQAQSIRAYGQAGVSGMLVQSFHGDASDFTRMRYYVNTQMMWDPTLDEQQLANEFLEGYYGDAAPFLRKYINLMKQTLQRDGGHFLSCYATTTRAWMTLDDMNNATQLFNHALEAVAYDETLSFRVRRARLGIEMVWLERFRELLAESRRAGKPFLGPEDPYALLNQMGRDEIAWQTYRPWRPMSEYVKKMRAVFPSRSGKTPGICQELEAYDWEDVQEHLFESVLDPKIVSVVDDSKASNGKAVRLVGRLKSLQVRTEIPAQLAGRWQVYVVARVQALGTRAGDQTGVAMGVDLRDSPGDAVQEVQSITVDFPAIVDSDYATYDLGVHDLGHGSVIWVKPNGPGAYGDHAGTWVDRIFLVAK